MKIRSSTKIAAGFIVLVAAVYYGYQAYANQTIGKIKFEPLTPGSINLVGIEPGASFRIQVSNDMVQLVQGKKDDFAGQSGPEIADDADKKRVPIGEMLEALQGNAKGLGEFVQIMNDLRENDSWPTTRVVWKEGDLQKALEGDKTLQTKLENDLNVKLDGTPLPQLSATSIENGIIVETMVPVNVSVNDRVQLLSGPVQTPFKPAIAKRIEKRLENKAYTRMLQLAYYKDEAQRVLSGEQEKENVRKLLQDLISDSRKQRLAAPAQQILAQAKVIVNEDFIKNASFRSYQSGDRKLNDMTIDLTDEGRNRLWQYSRARVGSQILLIVDGIPVAAPVVRHELAQQELTLTQLPDLVLVREAVDNINRKNQVTKK